MEQLENIILKNLIYNEEYARKVLPFLSPEYFIDRVEKIIFETVNSFIIKYNNLPTIEALTIDVGNNSELREEEFQSTIERISSLSQQKDEKPDNAWLLESTEKFCQDKAIYNAVVESIGILDETKTTPKRKDAIPSILSDALSVSFDPHIGHDYICDVDDRYDYYHRAETKIPFDLEYFNKITKDGLSLKTLNIALAGTGVGKSLFMCHMAASCLSQNYNVLYITLEMAEEKIAERIDANLLGIPLDDLSQIPKDIYERKFKKLKDNIKGRLIIKEYPTATASTSHFRHLFNELNLKKSFKANIVFIDYLNICTSARIKPGAQVNSYTYIKSIAEELRGLAVEYNIPIMSATQTTRTGFMSTDVGLEDTSESFGLPATADFMFAIISNDELEQLGQLLIKQLKNRYNDPTHNKRFVIGVDRSRMKLFDCAQAAQTNLVDSGQDADKDDIPSFDRATGNKFSRKKDFSGWQV